MEAIKKVHASVSQTHTHIIHYNQKLPFLPCLLCRVPGSPGTGTQMYTKDDMDPKNTYTKYTHLGQITEKLVKLCEKKERFWCGVYVYRHRSSSPSMYSV